VKVIITAEVETEDGRWVGAVAAADLVWIPTGIGDVINQECVPLKINDVEIVSQNGQVQLPTWNAPHGRLLIRRDSSMPPL